MPLGITLIFVYDASSDVLPKIKDYASKKAIPDTDKCNLYEMTHSPVGMKKNWKRFITDLGIPVKLLSSNEFSSEFGPGIVTYPVALLKKGNDLKFFISTDEINRCSGLEDLINLVQQRSKEFHM
ncbi:MAG: hypothetical protein CVV34_02205 [Methanomicrobiales archaeon HGW-Methanomicrobiales-5]|nr:MAG: hypothetical protein CVV34_02205 [Methanomicrobiales archaeon HGW-Methanomicrobiales-5]